MHTIEDAKLGLPLKCISDYSQEIIPVGDAGAALQKCP